MNSWLFINKWDKLLNLDCLYIHDISIMIISEVSFHFFIFLLFPIGLRFSLLLNLYLRFLMNFIIINFKLSLSKDFNHVFILLFFFWKLRPCTIIQCILLNSVLWFVFFAFLFIGFSKFIWRLKRIHITGRCVSESCRFHRLVIVWNPAWSLYFIVDWWSSWLSSGCFRTQKTVCNWWPKIIASFYLSSHLRLDNIFSNRWCFNFTAFNREYPVIYFLVTFQKCFIIYHCLSLE